MYVFLAALFFISCSLGLALLFGAIARPAIWRRNRRRIFALYALWFIPYFAFILFLTGPEDLAKYPPREMTPYRLPWKAGDERFVAQGNRSFTSHRGYHLYAWDFVMPTGTEVLAAREGVVTEVVDQYDGFGINANFVTIEHADGTSAVYAHIKAPLVKQGDRVQQGQPIALSGRVGQALFPHLHFYVIGRSHAGSIPISFADVPEDGVPLAGHFYVAGAP